MCGVACGMVCLMCEVGGVAYVMCLVAGVVCVWCGLCHVLYGVCFGVGLSVCGVYGVCVFFTAFSVQHERGIKMDDWNAEW